MSERRETGSSTVTLHDVAEAAGVSLATASRVLNGSTRTVQAAYRERVERAAAELGYTANLSAQATARGTSGIIALLVADIADPYFGEIAAGVAQYADEVGMVVTVAVTDRDAERELRLVRALRGQRPRAMILAASRPAAEVDERLASELGLVTAAGGSAVLFGSHRYNARAVDLDNQAAAAALGQALAGRGYRKAIALGASSGTITSDQRVSGFVDGFIAAGGEAPSIYRGDFSRDGGEQMMREALATGVAPGTLVFGVSDVVAMGAMSAVRAAGRAVGSDIAVAGFDDIPTAQDSIQPLTTVRVPLHDLGYEACRAAIDEEWSTDHQTLRFDVVIRESTPLRS